MRPPRPRFLRRLALLAVLAVAAAACAGPLSLGPRTVRTPVFNENRVRVFLRHREEGGTPMAMGFEHPRIISSIRLARVLMRVDIRERDRGEEKADRKAAISADLAYVVAEGMSHALERATPDQEVVVMAIDERKRLGVFSADYLTSLVAYVKDEHLWVVWGEVDSQLSDDPSEKPREPTRAGGKGFRVIPSKGIRSAGATTAVAAWRDPIFSKAAPGRTAPGSRKLRRTILLEESGASELEATDTSSTLSPATLRALAELEEERLAGSLSEANYRRRREELLAGED